MKTNFTRKSAKRFGGPKNHAFGETSERKQDHKSFKPRFPDKKRREEGEGRAPSKEGSRFEGRKRATYGENEERKSFKPRFERKDREESSEDRPRFKGGSNRFGGRKGSAFTKDGPRKSYKPRYDREEKGEEGTERPRYKPHFRDDEREEKRSFRDKPRFHDKARKAFGDRKKEEGGEEKRSFHKKPSFHDTAKKPFGEKRKEVRKEKHMEFPPPRGAYIWGLHAVREAWLNPKRRCFRLLVTESGESAMAEAIAAAREEGLARPACKQLQKEVLESLLPEGSVSQGIVLDVAPLEEAALEDFLEETESDALLVVLDQVTDPHNVGAILRSAAAFGAKAVIVTEHGAPQATGVMAKVACGGLEHVALVTVTNLSRALEMLGDAGYWRIGLAEEGEKPLAETKGEGKTALVLGAEGSGLRRLTREKCDSLARLPTQPPIGSLNVSNAAAIALYEIRRKA